MASFAVPPLCAVSAGGGLSGLAFDFTMAPSSGVSFDLFAVASLCAVSAGGVRGPPLCAVAASGGLPTADVCGLGVNAGDVGDPGANAGDVGDPGS